MDDTIASDKDHDSHLQETVHFAALGEERPPMDPGTDLSGSRGMESWLAGEELQMRGET